MEQELSYHHYTIKRLADGVYAAVATALGTAGCNSGIIDLGDETLIFDTSATLGSARELRMIAESLTGRPASYVINSHPHPDHVNGNAIFADHATLISSVATKAYLEQFGLTRMENMRISMTKEMQGFAEKRSAAHETEKIAELDAILGSYRDFFDHYPTAEDLRLPQITFEHAYTIQGSKRKIELLTFGGAHSVCDGVMWLPEEKILFTADLVIPGDNLILPTNDPADPDLWASLLDRCEELGPEQLVPGHRRLASAEEGFSWARQYLKDVYAVADDAIQAGKTPDEIDSVAIPEQYRPFTFRRNLRFLMERRAAWRQPQQ